MNFLNSKKAHIVQVSIITILLFQCAFIVFRISDVISYSFTLLYSLFCIKYLHVSPHFTQKSTKDKKSLYALTLAFIVAIFCSILFITKQTSSITITYILGIFCVNVYASFVEEVLFRRFILNVLYEIIKAKWCAIVINSILFGCVHIITIWAYGNLFILYKFLITFCISFVLSDIYTRTNSIFIGSVLHSIYNITIALGTIEPKILYFCIIEITCTWSFIIIKTHKRRKS